MNRNGFTLIELLIVVVIIGILAAIAIPKFGATKERAFIASMKADLRNLATAEEAYFYDNNAYYSGVVPNAALSYNASKGVTITLSGVSVAGWAATATHLQTAVKCGIFYGAATPAPPPATIEGQVACQ